MARTSLVGPALALAALALLELAARAVLALAPALGDPWSGRVGATMNAALVRHLETDLAVVSRRRQLYLPDRRLFWRLAPDVELEVENQVLETRHRPVVWTIRTNDLGFRGPPLPAAPSGLRILTLGDSCTFGFRVEEEATYPARLRGACVVRTGRPAVVLNAGVPGYTSHQGRRVLESLVDRFRPDVVTIAFGTNDRETDRLSDAERAAWLDTANGRLTWASQRSGVFRVLSGLLGRPDTPAPVARPRRVDVEAFRANVDAMIDLARRASARVVLLDLVFVDPVHRDALRALAASRDVPLVDGPATLDAAWAAIERGTAYRDEAEEWRRFHAANVVAVRPIYFDHAFYARHYPSEGDRLRFVTLMADPIHPNAIGHHALADALAATVCPGPEPGGAHR
jgi:lysophospholipase L1-like esterase